MNQGVFRRHFLAGRRGSAWRWIYQSAVLDDFFDLGAVQGFVLQQTFCDPFEFVAIRHAGRSGKLISVIHLRCSVWRRRVGVGSSSGLLGEELSYRITAC
jgi:hypothetical protein